MRCVCPGAFRPAGRLLGRSFKTSCMVQFLDGHNHGARDALRDVFGSDVFRPREGLSLSEARTLTYQRMREFTSSHLVSVREAVAEPTKVFAACELAGMVDGAVAHSIVSQFVLFGGTLLKLGSASTCADSADNPLAEEALDSFRTVGGWALGELGAGPHAGDIETTATYDRKTGTFILHTPTPAGVKMWVPGAASSADTCVVFATLVLPSGVQEGVHAFAVRIRQPAPDKTTPEENRLTPRAWEPVRGVELRDVGRCTGIDGVDLGSMRFDRMRVPRSALLGATAHVASDGTFTTTVPVAGDDVRKRRRFHVATEQLLSARLCVAATCLGATKAALVGAVRYAATPRASGGPPGTDGSFLAGRLAQRALMPTLATTYCLSIGLAHAQRRFEAIVAQHVEPTVSAGGDWPFPAPAPAPAPPPTSSLVTSHDQPTPPGECLRSDGVAPGLPTLLSERTDDAYDEAMRLGCMLKPLVSWHAERAVAVCREWTGGDGLLRMNRLAHAAAVAHGGVASDGDNALLFAKVTKDLIARTPRRAMTRYAAVSKLLAHTPHPLQGAARRALTRVASPAPRDDEWDIDADASACRPVAGDVVDPAWAAQVFRRREIVALCGLAWRLNQGEQHSVPAATLWAVQEADAIQRVARLHVERFVLRAMDAAITTAAASNDAAVRNLERTLREVRAMFALTRIAADFGPLVSEGVLSGSEWGTLDPAIGRLASTLAQKAGELVNGFGIPEKMLHAPIAGNWVRVHVSEEFDDPDAPRYVV
eukprot:TRINITY_DN56401_c0_g1_i1.p1 TRINITY_DN56401_c0_g1~~TRINITY_DN56401_c0_g1_i1.p1  ORF type:complete len:766 (+),score=155.37 TRINITY_DN56401_c0_g1_i1:361-2658(+)